MIRTLISISDTQAKMLDERALAMHISRSALIRMAIDRLLQDQKQQIQKDVFGIWKEREVNALEFQHKIRSEW